MADEYKWTPVQWVALLVVLLAVAGMVWAAVAFGKDIVSLIEVWLTIAAIALVFIGVFYLASGANTTESSTSFRLKLMERLAEITAMQWVASFIGLFTIITMAWVLITETNFFATAEKARGLVTLAVTIVTVAIALILVFFLVFAAFSPDDKDAKEEFTARFTLGKDVLMVFVGILGTIMGFYYGNTNKVAPEDIKTIQQGAPNAKGSAETRAFELLLKQDYDGAVKSFDDAYTATPISDNIKNIEAIRKLLVDKKDLLTAAGDKKTVWQDIYCEIANNKRAVGQSKEIIDKFNSACNPAPSPSPTAAMTPSPEPTSTP